MENLEGCGYCGPFCRRCTSSRSEDDKCVKRGRGDIGTTPAGYLYDHPRQNRHDRRRASFALARFSGMPVGSVAPEEALAAQEHYLRYYASRGWARMCRKVLGVTRSFSRMTWATSHYSRSRGGIGDDFKIAKAILRGGYFLTDDSHIDVGRQYQMVTNIFHTLNRTRAKARHS